MPEENTEFRLMIDDINTGVIWCGPEGDRYERVYVRVMGHLNPELMDNGYLLGLVGRTFKMGVDSSPGKSDVYEIRSTEGVVGYPKRMAVMATALRRPVADVPIVG